MNLFTDDAKGAHKDKVELARKAIADSGGPAIGSAAQASQRKDALAERQREQARRQNLTHLQIMLQDPGYAAAYERVTNALDDLQSRLDTAILANAEEIERMEANAARLEDGTMVFMDSGGNWRTASGDILPAGTRPADIPDNPTGYEDYRREKAREGELAEMQTGTVDRIRDAVTDSDNPPDKGQLDEFERELDRLDRSLDNGLQSSIDQDPIVPDRTGEITFARDFIP